MASSCLIMWFFTKCTFFQQPCCEIEIVKLIGQQALSVRRATRKDLWIFWCVQKTKWKFKAVPLEGTTSTHISPSLPWFVIHCFGTAPKHKTERGFFQHSSCDAANAEKRAFAGLARCTYGVWPFSPSETFVAGAIKSPRMRGGCESPVRCRQCLRLGMLLGPGRTWSYDQKWKEGAALCAKRLCKPAFKPGSPENV